MTALLLEETRASRSDALTAPAAETLEALVARTWAELQRRGRAACPACGAASMRALNAAGGAGPIGHCAACDSELS
jgi:hypothetical protein